MFYLKVTFKKTGQIMVMKETKTFDKEAQKIFVKEVSHDFSILKMNIYLSFINEENYEQQDNKIF